MSITETKEFFKTLLNETNNKRELRIYKSFIGVLSGLENANLSSDDLQKIQKEIGTLNINESPKNKKKYYSKKLKTFKSYLKKEFSLITEGYYTTLGMCLGMCFGSAIGTALGTYGISLGVALGMLIGLVIGKSKDAEAEKQNLVLVSQKEE